MNDRKNENFLDWRKLIPNGNEVSQVKINSFVASMAARRKATPLDIFGEAWKISNLPGF